MEKSNHLLVWNCPLQHHNITPFIAIIFLDDVFIGLDAGNRIPILNILQNEFKEYQIFITTYDRNWYEVAQRYFEGHAPTRWRHFELYVTPELVGMRTIDKPIILPRQEEYDRAVYHLHHRSRPDYPAAANYFRKYAEHILSNFMPPQEIRNEDYSLVESYRLGKYVNEAQRFMRNIGANDTFLTRLEYLLPTLLHPLSHFEITSNVYKAELVEIQQLLVKIEAQLSSIKDGYRLIIPQGRMVKLGFAIAANSTGYYDVFAKESVYLLRDSGGRLTLSKAQCHSKATYIVTNGVEVSRQKFANGDPAKDYSSIENAYDVIYRFINAQAQYSHIAKAATYKTEFTFVDKGISQSLDGWMNSIQW